MKYRLSFLIRFMAQLTLASAILFTWLTPPTSAASQGQPRELGISVISPPKVCAGETFNIVVEVVGFPGSQPVSGAAVTAVGKGSATSGTTGPSGGVSLPYQATVTGVDTIRLQASKALYNSGQSSTQVKVDVCTWVIDMFYFGSYKEKNNVWQFIEDSIISKTPILAAEGSVSGSGQIRYSWMAWPIIKGVDCDPFKSSASAPVNITGIIANRQLTLTVTPEIATFSDPGRLSCRYGQEFLFGASLPMIVLQYLMGPATFTVSADGGTHIISLSGGLYFIELYGKGTIVYTVKSPKEE